jgi:hypothetical protein
MLKFEYFYDHEYNTLDLSMSHVGSIFTETKTKDFYAQKWRFLHSNM